eukprot:3697386-Prymnesium_polylepis.1
MPTSQAGVLGATDVMARLSPFARPGYWNDPDLLLSVDYAGRLRMSEVQSRAQFLSLVRHVGPSAHLWQPRQYELVHSRDLLKRGRHRHQPGRWRAGLAARRARHAAGASAPRTAPGRCFSSTPDSLRPSSVATPRRWLCSACDRLTFLCA